MVEVGLSICELLIGVPKCGCSWAYTAGVRVTHLRGSLKILSWRHRDGESAQYTGQTIQQL